VSADAGAWPRYCEENVWRLCGALPEGASRAYATIISNASQSVAMWSQRAEPRPGLPIIWDYHAVLFARFADGWRVIDSECTLAPPLPAAHWLDACFRPLAREYAAFAPRFRLVKAETYRRELRTDRSHMLDRLGWRSPPPPWPCIGHGTNLAQFVDMQSPFLGEVLDLETLRARVRSPAMSS